MATGSYFRDLTEGLSLANNEQLNLTILGLLCSPSPGRIQLSLCQFKQAAVQEPLHLRILHHDELLVERELLEEAHNVMQQEVEISAVSELNVALGHTFASAIRHFCKERHIELSSIDAIASHGLTVWLQSSPDAEKRASVLSLGEGSVITADTGITTVTGFCGSDLANGRDGTPSIALLNALVLHHATKTRAAQCIDTLSSICFIPPGHSGGAHLSYDFDTGPCTLFTNAAVQRFSSDGQTHDNDGTLASRGTVNEAFVTSFLSSPFFLSQPPKRIGTTMLMSAHTHELLTRAAGMGLSPLDTIASLTRCAAMGIVLGLKKWGFGAGRAVSDGDGNRSNTMVGGVDEMFVYGAAAENRAILGFVKECFPRMRIARLNESGIPGEACEAAGFAWLALETLIARPLPSGPLSTPEPQVSHAHSPPRSFGPSSRHHTVIAGIYPGKNYRSVMGAAMRFGEGRTRLGPIRQLVVDEHGEREMISR